MGPIFFFHQLATNTPARFHEFLEAQSSFVEDSAYLVERVGCEDFMLCNSVFQLMV